MPRQQPIFLPPAGGRILSVGNASLFIKLASEASGGAMTITEYVLPGSFPGPPPHKHKVYEHAWYVLEGTLDAFLGTDWLVLTPGSFLFIPKHTVHAFANNSAKESRLLAIDTPGGFEKYYDDLQEAFGGARPVDQAVMRDIQLRYDTFPPDYDFGTALV